MSAIVTSNMRIHAATQFIDGFSDSQQHQYLFIGHTLPWSDDNTPPTPIDCPFDESAAFRDMMSLKLISADDVSLVVSRNDWTTGTVYTQYSNSIDLFDPSSQLPPFCVITDVLNVYKCLNNNGGVASTVKPTGTPTTVITNADGYQWKYMLTVNSADVLKFVTTEWFPVKTLAANDGSFQWLVQQAAVSGTIDRVDIVTTGSGYTANPDVLIVGDGTGATAVATRTGGNVTSIIVTSAGSNYTWANVVISRHSGDVAGNGATASAIVSPFAGHGADPVKELGAFFVIVNAKLIYDESQTFTVSNDFRRIGILKNPLLNDGITSATALDYSQTTRLYFSTVSGTIFDGDEVVTGDTSAATGVVVDFDSVLRILRVVETSGSFVPGETVVGAVASGVLQTITGTALTGSTNTIQLRSPASTTPDAYTSQTVKIMSNTGVGQIRVITGYDYTRTATVSPDWTTPPDSTSVYSIAKIVSPDLEPFVGDILYMENRRPIARASDQVEDVKIIVEF